MKPNKLLGQHFLVDKKALAKIVAAANIQKDETVLEIGPGTGLLTKELAARAQKVITIEKDPSMVHILKETLGNFENVEIIQGDALSYQVIKLSSYKVVANIPYYITAPIIRKFLEEKDKPAEMVLMVQKEVAQRICAKPPDMSILAVSVQFYATCKIISRVSKGCFWPVPKVDSAIIKIVPQITVDNQGINRDAFFRVVKAGFLHPRKKIIGNLREGLKIHKEQITSWLIDNKIDPGRRAETLTLQEWASLTRGLDMIT